MAKFLVNLGFEFLRGFLSGAILALLWNWFAVPFFAVPSMTILQGAGLLCVPHFVVMPLALAESRKHLFSKEKPEPVSDDILWNLVVIFVIYPIVLADGWF